MHNTLDIYGSIAGAHSLWELPVLTLRYGGVVFILVYLAVFLFLGSPLLLLEMGLGQYSSLGVTKLYRHLCPVSSEI
jgi:solute carrier family 6 amino acid transporter-like protein 5/7/9/14